MIILSIYIVAILSDHSDFKYIEIYINYFIVDNIYHKIWVCANKVHLNINYDEVYLVMPYIVFALIDQIKTDIQSTHCNQVSHLILFRKF